MQALGRKLVILCLMGFVACTFIGCQKEEGTAEKAGKKIDQAIDSTKEKFQEATK